MALLTKRKAIKAGKRRGIAAASWVFDGNTSGATYRAVLRMLDDGDPALFDAVTAPNWLSGDSIGELLGSVESRRDENREDDVMQAYEDAAELAFWAEVERVARYQLED